MCLHEKLYSIVLHFVCVENITLHCGLKVLMSQALHNSLRLRSIFGQYGAMGMPEAVAVKERVSQFVMNHPGAIFERLWS